MLLSLKLIFPSSKVESVQYPIFDRHHNYDCTIHIDNNRTNSHADIRWCAVSSTVAGHHTDVVVLIILQRQVDGSVRGDEGGLRFIIMDQRRETDDIMVSQSSCTPINEASSDCGSNSLKKMEDLVSIRGMLIYLPNNAILKCLKNP